MDEASALCREAESGATNPRDVKRRLAREIVALYHGQAAADSADDYFVQTFSKRQQPVAAEDATIPDDLVGPDGVPIAALIAALGLAKSNGQARQLIEAGAVTLDSEKLTNPALKAQKIDLVGKVLKVGKHQFRTLR